MLSTGFEFIAQLLFPTLTGSIDLSSYHSAQLLESISSPDALGKSVLRLGGTDSTMICSLGADVPMHVHPEGGGLRSG